MTELDNKLVENIKDENCEDSLKELILRHSPLCYNILQKFYPLLNKAGFSKDDVFNEKDLLIYKSAKTFKLDKKTKYSTWLGNYTRYHCLNMLNSTKIRFVSVEEEGVKSFMEKQVAEQDLDKEKHMREFISHILDNLKDKRIKKIYMMRYFSKDGKKKTWKEIAKKVGVSSQTVINIHNKTNGLLRTKLKAENNLDFV